MSKWESGDPHAVLPPELVDRLDEILTRSESPHCRAAAIFTLVGQIYEATAWQYSVEFTTDHRELVSLAKVLDAAADHRARMRSDDEDAQHSKATSSKHGEIAGG